MNINIYMAKQLEMYLFKCIITGVYDVMIVVLCDAISRGVSYLFLHEQKRKENKHSVVDKPSSEQQFKFVTGFVKTNCIVTITA